MKEEERQEERGEEKQLETMLCYFKKRFIAQEVCTACSRTSY